MKKAFFASLAILLLVVGCATFKPFMNTGEERTAGIGDIFFEDEPKDGKYQLTIVELNNEKIGLLYNEFFHSNQWGWGSGWMIKEGFNKRFDYALADKVIRFREYAFEILEAGGGQIKYRRIK